MTLHMSIDTSAIDALIRELEGDIESAIRPAAQAGAQVIYDQVKLNVSRIKRKTGLLESAIYQAFDKLNSTPERAVYGVSWNSKKAPHAYNVENGHWRKNVFIKLPSGKMIATKERLAEPVWVAAKPFMRPAFDAADRASAAVSAEFLKRIGER